MWSKQKSMTPFRFVSFVVRLSSDLFCGGLSLILQTHMHARIPTTFRLAASLLLLTVTAWSAPIDRHALVTRHNVVLRQFDAENPLTVGNGEFAFTVDATGLQTFPEAFEKTIPLGTLSDWGWHTIPNTNGWSIDTFHFKEFSDLNGRPVPYADVPGNQRTPEINWLRSNPHRLHLGQIGFVLTHTNGSPAQTNDLTDIEQTLDLWDGLIVSRFKFDGQPVTVETVCDPILDAIAVCVESPLVKQGRLMIEIYFPYGTGETKTADWTKPDAHETILKQPRPDQALFHRKLDKDEYYVAAKWTAGAVLAEVERHKFAIGFGPDGRAGSQLAIHRSPLPAAERRARSDAPYLVSLSDLVPFIDWSPFFHTWELRGRYPAILNHPNHGGEARKLFADAQELLEKIVAGKLIAARGVYGFFPASRVGDDVELYTDESRSKVLTTFHFLRQQIVKGDGTPNWCLADFIAPKAGRESRVESREPDSANPALDPRPSALDHIGAFAVTSGHGLDELVKKFKADHDDYNAIMAEALADRLAEAFAEYLHKRVREEWGFGKLEKLTTEDIIAEEYRGIRPAAGYPACPDHTEKGTLWKLLDVEKNADIKLTESFAMWPGSSVSGLYFAHPESKYFAVGKLGRDQVLDYHVRKGLTLQETERWLGLYLNYDPALFPALEYGRNDAEKDLPLD
jgi:hypothetical protein